MHHNRWIRLAQAALAVLCLALAVPAVPAAADVTISVSPASFELSAPPGARGSQQVTVYNDGSDAFRVSARVDPYKGAVGERSAVEWLKVDPPAFDLPPGGRQVVTASLVVPERLPPGGRYATVTFETGAAAVAESGAAVAGRLGVPFLITVEGAGPLTRRADLEGLLPVLEPDGRLSFRATLANRGDLHLAGRGGAVDVVDESGTSVGRLNLAQTTPILPGGTELLRTQGGLQLGDGGRYGARAVAEYGGPAPAAAEAKFAMRSGLEIDQLEVREQPGREPALRIKLHNTAELGLLPKLQLSVRDRAGRTFLSAVPVRVQLLPPGEPLEIVDVLPIQLPEGEYVLAARAEFGGRAADREVTFTIGTPAAAPDPAWADGGHVAPAAGRPAGVPGVGATKDGSWWSPGVLLALAALATVLLLTFLALRLLRARRAQLSDADEFGIEAGPGKASQAVPEPTSEAERRVTSLLEEGQLAARSGDRFLAHRLFTRVVELDPAREEAWLWRAGTAEHSDEAIACLRRVLEINPGNRQARQGLDALRTGTTAG